LRVYLTSKMFDLDVDYTLEDLGGRASRPMRRAKRGPTGVGLRNR
jgi:hypothetical protein